MTIKHTGKSHHTECLQLRVKDIDFAQKQLIVRDAKGRESQVTMLPTSLIEELQFHLQIVKRQHQQDLEKGYGSDREWIWQFVFSSNRISQDPRSKIKRSFLVQCDRPNPTTIKGRIAIHPY